MMDRKKKKFLIILAIACPVLVWRLSTLTRYFPSHAQAVPQTESIPSETTMLRKASAPVFRFAASPEAQQKIREGPWGRDQFELPVLREEPEGTESAPALTSASPKPPTIKFTGVSKSRGDWMAVVGGVFVRVGDVIDSQYHVRAIGKGSITLESQEWQFHYELGVDTPLVTRRKGAP